MRQVYVVSDLQDEAVLVFESEEDAKLAGKCSALSCVITEALLIERGEDEEMPTE